MLTSIRINAATPAAKARALSDSQGLYLVVQPNGSKLWRFRYRFLDRQKTLHLGGGFRGSTCDWQASLGRTAATLRWSLQWHPSPSARSRYH
jgi:hypothetical protein